MPIQIDPRTGERVPVGVPGQIDPATGERIPTPPVAGAGPGGPPQLDAHPGVNMQPSSSLVPAALTAGNVGVGAAKGLLHTVAGADDWARQHLPAFMTNSDFGFGPPANLEHVHQMATPQGTAQKIGYGGEQVGEFLIPGGAEESAAEHLGELAPKIKPLARIAASALGAGTVNKAQGGSFGGGAAGGAVGGAVGEGLRAVAPRIAESAINIRKLDRAYGKSGGAIGRTILDETTGLSPSSVAESAQSRLDELNPQLNQAADRASVRPNQAKGLLPAPAQEIPLGATPQPPEMPGGIFDAQQFPPQNVGEARIIRNRAGQILPRSERIMEFPDANGQLPVARNYSGQFLTRQPTRAAWMTGIDGELPDTPEFSGPGVLLRRPEVGSEPIPNQIPAPSASLRPARSVLANALGTATRQGERTTATQLQPMFTHLGETVGGDAIPENITPRRLLDLKRGFGNEFIHRWNPETMTGVKGTAAQTYRAMGDEFNRVVPEAQELNGRISRLIPVAKRAESAELNAPTTQRMFQRVAAPTGALAGAVGGGAAGYEQGGATGAAKGAAAGLMLPLLLTTPTGEMMMARAANGLARPVSKMATGSFLQLNRKQQDPKESNR